MNIVLTRIRDNAGLWAHLRTGVVCLQWWCEILWGRRRWWKEGSINLPLSHTTMYLPNRTLIKPIQDPNSEWTIGGRESVGEWERQQEVAERREMKRTVPCSFEEAIYIGRHDE